MATMTTTIATSLRLTDYEKKVVSRKLSDLRLEAALQSCRRATKALAASTQEPQEQRATA
jgi:hypothetical protein